MGIVVLIAAMAFAAGAALRLSDDGRRVVAPTGATAFHEDGLLAAPRLLSADPGPLHEPRRSTEERSRRTAASPSATVVVPAPALVAPAPTAAPSPSPSPSPAAEDGPRFGSGGEGSSGSFDLKG
jgi:hypothetical protein